MTVTPGNQFPETAKVQRVRFHDAPELRRTEKQEVEIRRKLQRKGASSEIPNRRWSFRGKKYERIREIVNEEAEWVESLLEKRREVHVFIGDLSTPTPSGKGSLSRRLNSFPYGELKNRLQHRLKREGAHVHLVDKYNSSRTCPECGSTETERPTQGTVPVPRLWLPGQPRLRRCEKHRRERNQPTRYIQVGGGGSVSPRRSDPAQKGYR